MVAVRKLWRCGGRMMVIEVAVRGVQQQVEQRVRMHVRRARAHLDREQEQAEQCQQAQGTGSAEGRDGAWQVQGRMLRHGCSRPARFTRALYHPVTSGTAPEEGLMVIMVAAAVIAHRGEQH